MSDRAVCGGTGEGPRDRRSVDLYVTTRQQMDTLLREYDWLLREVATAELGETAEVEAAILRTTDRLLAVDQPAMSHALGAAVALVLNECRRIQQRARREPARYVRARAAGIPVDPLLGPIEGQKADAVAKLPSEDREILMAHAHDRRLVDIARLVGKSASTVRTILSRARDQVEVSLREDTAPVWLLIAPNRLRSVAVRVGGRLSDHLIAGPGTVALVPLLACSMIPSTRYMPQAPPSPPPVAAASMATVSGQVAPTETPPRARSFVAPAPPHPADASRAPAATPDMVARRTAATETPEDVTINDAATPPSRNGAIVAVGWGHACACEVLMRSLDGGAAWAATDGPPTDVSQLALPPDYPRDGRIFGGVTPYDVGAPYVSAGFGAPFQRITGLPPGLIALSAGFDQGDERVWSSALTGVWSLRLGTAAPRQEIAYAAEPLTSNAVAALATPHAGGPAVLAWAPADSVVPGSLAGPSFSTILFECSSACVARGSPGDPPPWQLAVAESTIVAYDRTALSVSVDDGQSFSYVPLPSDATAIGSVAVADKSPWLSFARIGGGMSVVRRGTDGRWADAADGAPLLRSHMATLVQIDDRRILASLPEAGYRCTVIGSGIWLPRCPAM